jgi:septal ring factor EnvC (AmiA/AmiB activator)
MDATAEDRRFSRAATVAQLWLTVAGLVIPLLVLSVAGVARVERLEARVDQLGQVNQQLSDLRERTARSEAKLDSVLDQLQALRTSSPGR